MPGLDTLREHHLLSNFKKCEFDQNVLGRATLELLLSMFLTSLEFIFRVDLLEIVGVLGVCDWWRITKD